MTVCNSAWSSATLALDRDGQASEAQHAITLAGSRRDRRLRSMSSNTGVFQAIAVLGHAAEVCAEEASGLQADAASLEGTTKALRQQVATLLFHLQPLPESGPLLSQRPRGSEDLVSGSSPASSRAADTPPR
eukprot:CAMPEP_0177261218 /NCGR_PEP_ID=MMETSP0367-20130122/59703_1 /TAXON_ID=447022 ORGANISM="Scrippsiella hangoei-like, Strain SHHI-4" /NCGR_SAMPLE_ID=MMETSP0367 /ASSEMBLY_ACC=CAM_ASM_000362 /LENGTH=131 /DNA_ID=CAMNT_0018715845 /DNA_START=55 /DNA_END=450 /DNA_ORIENTATION=+